MNNHRSTSYLISSAINNPLPDVSLTAFILGIILGISLPLTFIFNKFFQFPLYISIVCLFHFLEYFITASWQSDKVSIDSYVINNGATYLIAHSIAIFESIIEIYFYPNFKSSYLLIRILGVLIVILGQILRSMAMINCGESFSHIISTEKKSNHKLITSGIYSLVRHPSYVGFFYWAIGTQILLLNPISLIIFIFLLYKFFSNRINFEESKLIEFFGDDYIQYKLKVNSGLPFL